MPLEGSELLALALALEEEAVDDDQAAAELAAGAEGSAVTLQAAHAHALSLARELPYDEKAQRTVELLQRALQRAHDPAAVEPGDEGWLRPGRDRRPPAAGEPGRSTLADRLSSLRTVLGDSSTDPDALASELERLRETAVEERRRGRWRRP
jgi:hypothetical protein